jgi:hypothetical protein
MHNFPKASIAVALINAASCANTAAATGSAVNLMASDFDGPMEFTQNIGAVTGTIVGKIQDSADGSTDWQDVSGAAFASVGTANNTQRIVVNAQATRGYVRYLGTIVTGPALVAVTCSGTPKTV